MGVSNSDRPVSAASGFALDHAASERADFAVAGPSAILVDQAGSQVRDVHADGASSLGFQTADAVEHDIFVAATTGLSLTDPAVHVRSAVVSAVTRLGFRYLGGARPPETLVNSRIDSAVRADVVRELRRSASSQVNLRPAATDVRAFAVAGSSNVAIARSAAGRVPLGRELRRSGRGRGRCPRRALPGHVRPDPRRHRGPRRQGRVPGGDDGDRPGRRRGAERAVHALATTQVRLAVGTGGVRILNLSAATTFKLYQDARGTNEALGGNPVATHYIGYLGQFQQGQTTTLMIRTTGYQGRIVAPSAAPSTRVYDDSNVVPSLRPLALDWGFCDFDSR